jgi:hypothetical protein
VVRHRPWTEVDVANLRRMASRYPAEQVAIRLGRRLLDTNFKAHELRISLRINSSRESPASNLDPGPAGMDLTD